MRRNVRRSDAVVAETAGWAAVLLLFACGPAVGKQLLDRQGPAVLANHGIDVVWQLRLPTRFGRQIRQGLVGRDHVYFISGNGVIYCLGRRAGQVQWVHPTGRDFEMISGWCEQSPMHENEPIRHLYVTAVSVVLVYDIGTGRQVARVDLPSGAGGAACGDGQRIYSGSANGKLSCVDIADGRVVWRMNCPGPILSPVVHQLGRLYFLSGSNLCLADARQRSPLGQVKACRPLPPATAAWLAIGDRQVYVSCSFGHTGQVVAMEDDLSSTAWWTATLGPISGHPVQRGALVYQPLDGAGVLAVRADTGRTVFKIEQARQYLCETPDVLVLLGEKALLLAERRSGRIKAQVPLRGRFRALQDPQLAQAVIYDSETGQVICLQARRTEGPATGPQAEPAKSLVDWPRGAESAASGQPPGQWLDRGIRAGIDKR